VDVRVEQVADDRTWALRQSVLRPHESVDQVAASDLLASAGPPPASFAALDGRGEVVGTVRVAAGEPPSVVSGLAPEGVGRWRLRGMAVRADLRNAGLGTRLLGRALAYVAGHGGGLLWCNARVPAVGLYRRAGFEVHGEPWDDPAIGPHVVMARLVESDPPGQGPG
jgi:GNAT superfamily N-acetyltransferase